MSRNLRDHAAEYARRIARGHAFGLSRSQARGHPKMGELKASTIRKRRTYTPKQKYDEVVRLVHSGKSVTAARKELGFSHKAFTRLNKEFRSLKTDAHRRYRLKLGYFNFIDASGQLQEKVPFAGSSVVVMRDYEDAYDAAMMSSSSTPLKPFRNVVVVDADGRKHRLATDINVIKKTLKTMKADRAASFAEGLYDPSEVLA
jgi:hypothetical protein